MEPDEVTREKLAARPPSQAGASTPSSSTPSSLQPSAPEGPPAPQAERPLWVPYEAPPPPGWRGRGALLIRRYGFAVVLAAFAAALAALLLDMPAVPEHRGAVVFENAAPGSADGATAAGAFAGTAFVSVDTRPSGATVFVGGEAVGMTPLRRFAVPAGVHMISVQKEGHAPVDTLVTLRSEAVPTFRLALLPQKAASSAEAAQADGAPGTEAAPPPSAEEAAPPERAAVGTTGGLRIVSEPSGATVLLDGQYAGTTPLTVAEAPAGQHNVTFRLDGHATHTRTITVAAGRTRTISRTLRPAATATLRLRVAARGAVAHVNGRAQPHQADGTYAVALAPGRHHLAVTHASGGTWEQHITLRAGETRSITVDFGRSQRRRGW